MQVTVRLFSPLSLGDVSDRQTLELPQGARVGDLLEALRAKSQDLNFTSRKMAILIHHQVALPDRPLQEGDEVFLVPIMDGG